MRRNYDRGYYRELLARVRERLPAAALGSDIIVGFPGESDAQFNESLAYFESLPLTYFHVFPYSSRRGTEAAARPGHVSGPVKKSRARRMRELGTRKKHEFYSRFLGQTTTVLIEEKRDEATGATRGFTPNYLPVLVAGAVELVNREVPVLLNGIRNGWLAGEILDGGSIAAGG
jgi:threonylcarbamoyladenosine tRNA methylthiotransferase MtaB